MEDLRFRPRLRAFLIASFVLFAATLTVISSRISHDTSSHRTLKFSKDGTFQIAVFSDLHFGENAWSSWGPRQDINSAEVMRNVLDAESQQLVVLNGDLITGENTFKSNSSNYVDRIVEPLLERDLLWASTYGNHDSAFNFSRAHIPAQERKHPNALTDRMVMDESAGISNYYLLVHPYDGCSIPSLVLWFFDSRGGHAYQERTASGRPIGLPNWVDASVVEWFISKNDMLVERYGRVIPALAFTHIPTNASRAFQTEVGVAAHLQPGIDDDNPLAQQAEGWCSDESDSGSCPYGGEDVPFMGAITSTPGLMAMFSGHDHGNTWCYRWDGMLPGMTVKGNGIHLCFGQHSGYGGYGSWARRARQIYVTQSSLREHSIESWIRLETGEVVGAVLLNSTYNIDWYSATQDTRTHCPTCN